MTSTLLDGGSSPTLWVDPVFQSGRLAQYLEVRLLSATQGGAGLELARRHRPDVILLDLHLPDVPGDEVLRQVRSDPHLRATPVVVISADATPPQIERLRAAGAWDYLTKPLDVNRLVETMAALGVSRRQDSAKEP